MELIEIKKKNKYLIDFINNKKMGLLSFLIIANLVYLFVGSYLYTICKMDHNTFSLGLIPFFCINLIVGIIVNVKENYKVNKLHICGIAIIILGGISTIFAVNRQVSIFGMQERDEGLLTIIYYFSVMYLSSFIEHQHKKKIISFMLILGIVQCIYAILQISGSKYVQRVIQYYGKSGSNIISIEVWATGFVNNPNFFGTQMLLFLTYSMGLYFDEQGKNKITYHALLSGLFMYGLLISNTTSCAIGLVVCMIFTFIYALKNKMYKKFVALLVIVGAITVLAVFQHRTTLIKDVTKTGQEVSSMAKGDINDTYGTKRVYIWRKTLEIVPKNLVHGVGIDNYFYAFDGKALKSMNGKNVYDKAHNEYLQILVCEGLACLLVYCVMYAGIMISGVKKCISNKELCFILPVIGYLVQAFFNISVIEVAPLFFMTIGFNVSMNVKKKESSN